MGRKNGTRDQDSELVGVKKFKSMVYDWCTNEVGASNKLLIKYTQCKPVLPDKLIPAVHTIACHYHVFVSAVLRMVYLIKDIWSAVIALHRWKESTDCAEQSVFAYLQSAHT